MGVHVPSTGLDAFGAHGLREIEQTLVTRTAIACQIEIAILTA